MNLLKKYSQSTFFFILLFFVLSLLIPKFSIFNNLIELPTNYKLPVAKNITFFTQWLIEDATLGIFTFKEFTRAIGSILDIPSTFLKGLLATGFKFETANGGTIFIEPFSWISVIFVFVMIGVWLKDISLSIFVAISFFYVALFDLWESTMTTFSSIIVAVIIGIIFGTFLGILSYKFHRINNILTPTFDFMQTMPVFAYLVPALMLFGYGPAAALIVTLIYAMPPMARVTKNALDQVDSEVIELAQMVGCSTFQMLKKV